MLDTFYVKTTICALVLAFAEKNLQAFQQSLQIS
jgi:hypothetical protein